MAKSYFTTTSSFVKCAHWREKYPQDAANNYNIYDNGGKKSVVVVLHKVFLPFSMVVCCRLRNLAKQKKSRQINFISNLIFVKRNSHICTHTHTKRDWKTVRTVVKTPEECSKFSSSLSVSELCVCALVWFGCHPIIVVITTHANLRSIERSLWYLVRGALHHQAQEKHLSFNKFFVCPKSILHVNKSSFIRKVPFFSYFPKGSEEKRLKMVYLKIFRILFPKAVNKRKRTKCKSVF